MGDRAEFELVLLDKVTGKKSKISGAIRQLEGDLEKLGRKAEKGGGLMEQAFAHAAGGLIEEGIRKVADLTTELGGAVVEAANFAQLASLGFQSVAKHGASSEKLFAHARELAQDLGLDVFDTTKQFTKFLALQFNPKMATDLLKMGADMRVFGASSEEVQRIFAQLGQIQAKGKLQGEELIVLAENGLSTQLVYEHLQKQLGKTRAEILKMQQAGKLTSDMAFPAIMAAVMQKTGEKQLGDVGKRVANETLAGMSGKLKAEWQNMLIDLGRGSTPAMRGALEPIGAELSALMQNPALREGIIVAFEKVGGVVRDAIPFVKTFVGSLVGGFEKAWPAIEQALGALFEGFGGQQDWMTTVEHFAELLGEIIAFGVGVGTVFGGMVAAGIQIATELARELIAAWDWLIEGTGKVLFAIDDFFANMGAKWRAFDFGALATSMIDGLVNGIMGGISRVVDAVGSLGEATLSKLKGVLGIHSPSKEFEWLGEMSAAGYNKGANDNFDLVGPKVASMTSGVRGAGASLMGEGGGISVTFGDTIFQIQGADTSDGRKLGQQAAAAWETGAASFFERLRLQAAA